MFKLFKPMQSEQHKLTYGWHLPLKLCQKEVSLPASKEAFWNS